MLDNALHIDLTKPEVMARFAAVSPVPYRAFKALCVGDIDNLASFYIEFQNSANPSDVFKVFYKAYPRDGAGVKASAQDLYTIDFINNVVLKGSLFCTLRDRALGRHMFARRVAVAKALGCDVLELNAAAEIGGYTWARAGVYVMLSDRVNLSEALKSRLSFVKDRLDAQTFQKASKLAKLRKPEHLQKLAYMDTPIHDAPPLYDAALQAEGTYPLDSWKMLVDNKLVPSTTIPLGMFLLAAQDYDADIYLHDADQLAKISAYTKTDIPALVKSVMHARRTVTPIADTTPKRVRDIFERVADIDYARFVKTATHGLKGELDFILSQPSGDTPVYQVEYRLLTPKGGAEDSYHIAFDEKTIYPGYVRSRIYDRCTGRRMFGNRVRTGLALGLDRLELNAGARVGGYMWARAGVYVDGDDRKALSNRLQTRLEVVRSVISSGVFNRASNFAALRKETHLKKLAMLDTPIPHADMLFEEACARIKHKSKAPWQLLEDGGFVKGTTMPLGQFLLFMEDYAAHVDLYDKKQLASIGRYTGTRLTKTNKPKLA